jgi:hypothetical protein
MAITLLLSYSQQFCDDLFGDRVYHAIADLFNVNDVSKTIRGFKKGSRDGVGGGGVESKIDDMVEGMARNGGLSGWRV